MCWFTEQVISSTLCHCTLLGLQSVQDSGPSFLRIILQMGGVPALLGAPALQQSCLQNQLKILEFKSYTMVEQQNRLPKPLNFGLKI